MRTRSKKKSTMIRDFLAYLCIAFGISLTGFSIAIVSLLGVQS
jgi:hypothetical protein